MQRGLAPLPSDLWRGKADPEGGISVIQVMACNTPKPNPPASGAVLPHPTCYLSYLSGQQNSGRIHYLATAQNSPANRCHPALLFIASRT